MNWKEILKLTPMYDWFGKRSYSQSGEDIIVDAEIGRKRKGFYIDIGAFHPKVFSNSYMFYKRGWNGVCVEPNPQMKLPFKVVRSRDTFLNCGVSALVENKTLDYFVFDEPATNTFSAKQASNNQRLGRKLIKKISLPVVSIGEILGKYVPKGKHVDFLSIDIEGMDLAILKSIDWKKFKPGVVICEELDKTSSVRDYMTSKGYELKGMTSYSLVFKRRV